jgi:hypothetical protein
MTMSRRIATYLLPKMRREISLSFWLRIANFAVKLTDGQAADFS